MHRHAQVALASWLAVAAAQGCRQRSSSEGASSQPPAESAPSAASSAAASAASSAAASARSPEDDGASGEAEEAREAAGAASLEAYLEARAPVAGRLRRVLYTWTTDEQAAKLQKGQALLSRTLSGKGLSLFDQRIREPRDAATREMAMVLRRAPYNRRRFAAASPWAAAMGHGGERYGDVLVRVELRDEALVARFDPDDEAPWQFFDRKGRPVPLKAVLERPSRLGAVVHIVQSDAQKPAEAFREVVLVHEAMIARWSLGGPALEGELAEAASRLRTLATLGDGSAASPLTVTTQWRRAPTSPREAYLFGLSFVDEAYGPTPRTLEALAARLEKAAASARPFTVKPDPPEGPATSASGSAGPPPDAAVQKQHCTRHGTFVRCNPLPPAKRRAHDGRFCLDEEGRMVPCR